MRKTSIAELLPKIRRIILEHRATAPKSRFNADDRCAIGLSWLTWQVGETRNSGDWRLTRSKFTSGGLKAVRGHVQACLAILAREGIMFSRTRPEPGVQRYEHGETDKWFRVRITREEAVRRLAKS